MFDVNFISAMSSSFWIIPREGTEALLVVIMLISALNKSGREEKVGVIYKNCIAALVAGLLLAFGCIYLSSIFTGQAREISEGVASLLAMSMLLYVNFETFSKRENLHQLSLFGLGALAFVSVFRELAETILFYYGLFQGNASQQFGTLSGLMLGIVLFSLLLLLYKYSSDRYRKVNRVIFSLTPWFIFILAVMCVGNAVNAFQEANLLGFTPTKWMFNNSILKTQSSVEYLLSISMFLVSTGFLFLKQFGKSVKDFTLYLAKSH
ncbi:FTR1 family protein [Vibrio sp. S4M6]|uniref:FTR1 family protein n=1 Tax=Vibrio sinus TaxID=2946865 RepID=UPI002029C538|nr:FTR1 family protein [Vibrio sinus]MCL9781844.1 FTR1 family protein [Vibrio sinus]